MATLIPALGACTARMTPGERRLAERLDPATNSLLALYDDAQSIYERSRSKQFSFKSVGIQAQGRTTILKINYRNARQILQTASLIAADLLNAAHQEGHAWADMAVLCRHHHEMDECAQALSRWQLPFEVRARPGNFHPHEDTIKVMTMHASKGLEFPVVALMGVGQMPAAGEDERDEARLFYVGATRATQRLVIGAGGDSAFAGRITGSLA